MRLICLEKGLDQVEKDLTSREFVHDPTKKGQFSRIFVHPTSDTVAKVAKTEDPGWMAFAQLCLKNHNITSLPNIIKYETFKENGKNLFHAEMEKLSPLTFAPPEQLIGLAAYMITYAKDYCSTLILPQWANMVKGKDKKEIKQLALGFTRGNMDFLKALNLIKENASWFKLDLGPGNIMFRPSTGSVVIIDPYAMI